MKKILIFFLTFTIFSLSYVFSDTDLSDDVYNLNNNEYYKKAMELLDEAKSQFDYGDYDKGYDLSEEAKTYLIKANEYNLLMILMVRADKLKKDSRDILDKAKNLGAEKIERIKVIYDKSENLYNNGCTNIEDSKNFEEISDKSKELQKAVDTFKESIANSHKILQELSVDIDYARERYDYAVKKHQALLNDNIITKNDNDDTVIVNTINEAKDSFDKNDFYLCAEKSKEAMEYMENLEAEKYLAKALKMLNQAKSNETAKDNSDDIMKADNTYSSAESLYSDSKYPESISKSKEVIAILSNIKGVTVQDDSGVLPKYYKVRLIKNKRDCLWRIAGYPFVYNNPWKWRELYKKNKDKLPNPNNANWIEPGIILEIPSIKGEERKGEYDPEKKYKPLK